MIIKTRFLGVNQSQSHAQFKSNQNTTVDETTTTFTNVDIGAPYANRVVVLFATYGAGAGGSTATVAGISPYKRTVIGRIVMSAFQVPIGTTATIILSNAGSLRKSVSVYIIYPANPNAINVSTVNVPGVSAVSSALTVKAGGIVLYGGGSPANSNPTWTTTWSGAEAVVEDFDSGPFEAETFTSGHVNIVSDSTVNTLTFDTGGFFTTIQMIAASWGP